MLKNRHIVILIIIVFSTFNLKSQERTPIAKYDKVKSYISQSKANRLYSPRAMYDLADSALSMAKTYKDYNYQADAYILKGAALIDLGFYKNAIDTLNVSLKFYESFLENHSIAYNYALLGRAYTQLGSYYYAKDNFQKAKEYFDKISLSELKNDHIAYNEYAKLQNYLGLLHKRLNNDRLALDYHFKELNIYRDLKDTLFMGAAYGDIGRIHNNLGNTDSALYYTQMAYNIISAYGETILLANIEKKFALIYSELNDYIQALKYFNMALVKYKRFEDKQGMIVCINNIGRIYSKTSAYGKALEQYDQALNLAKEINDVDNMLYIYKFKSDVYKASGDFKMALECTSLYISIKDSVYQLEKEKSVQELEAKYKIKEQKISIQELQMKSQKSFMYFTLTALIVALCFVILIYNRYKIKVRLNNALEINNTELNKVYEDAVISKQEVENLVNIKQNIIRNLSYELRNPFNVIFGYVNLLKRETNQYHNDTLNTYLEHISNNANSLLGTLNDLYELNRIENGDYIVKNSTFPIKELFNSISSKIEDKAIAKSLSIHSECSEKYTINSDYTIIERILTHLLENAIKYTDKGGITLACEKIRNTSNIEFKLSVKDSGIGLSKNMIDNVLSDFIQDSMATDKQPEGAILGLAITKKFVDLLNGRIEILSEKDKGTTFNVYLHSTDNK